jgi:hypothetical protein
LGHDGNHVDLKVEGDASLVGLEILHDLWECGVHLEDEALRADDGEVETGELVEHDPKELTRHVEVLLRATALTRRVMGR